MGKKIFDENGNFLGELDDNIFKTSNDSSIESNKDNNASNNQSDNASSKPKSFKFERKILISIVSLMLVFAVIFIAYNTIFKADSDVIHDFLDNQKTVVYKDISTGISFNTYFFDKNQENGLGRQKRSDVFYLVQVREKNIGNKKYYFQTSTLFEWGNFAGKGTDIEFDIYDSNNKSWANVIFTDFKIDKGLQRAESGKTEVGYCYIEGLTESSLISYAKDELRDFISKSKSFVSGNNLPDLMQ